MSVRLNPKLTFESILHGGMSTYTGTKLLNSAKEE